jgi:hypothetical protein
MTPVRPVVPPGTKPTEKETTMATATARRTLDVSCPFCLTEDATIVLDLGNLDECKCEGCDATFSAAVAATKFEEMMLGWKRVAAWVDAAPTTP